MHLSAAGVVIIFNGQLVLFSFRILIMPEMLSRDVFPSFRRHFQSLFMCFQFFIFNPILSG